jgi:hypothetical protein
MASENFNCKTPRIHQSLLCGIILSVNSDYIKSKERWMFEGLRHKHGSLESKTLRDVLEFILLYINAEWGLTEGTASYAEQS